VTIERDWQLKKHCLQRIFTDDGMQIDESAEHSAKAHAPIEDSLESDSNATCKTERHVEQQPAPMELKEEGMQTRIEMSVSLDL
jgi:hypothetical protein